MSYRRETAGMVAQSVDRAQLLSSLQGDLNAIAMLRERARLPFSSMTCEAKKRLWNAHSRLVTRLSAQLGVTDPNSVESVLLRELIGLASVGIEQTTSHDFRQ